MSDKTKTNNTSNDYDLKKELKTLYPKDDIDITLYEKILDSALSDEKCLNIAITGSYGAGKSSLINTFEKNKQEHYIRISLAHFSPIGNDSDGDKTNPEGKLEAERILEGKILNQLIHQTDEKSIPLTKFKIKNTPEPKTMKKYCDAIAFFILLLVFCIFNDAFCSFLFVEQKNIPHFINAVWFRLLTLFALLIMGGIFLYKIIMKTITVGGVKKLNIKGNEIELFDGFKDSFFDRYLDEILYLLVNQNSKVIVFEDIDRFNDNLIFERLREINTLANCKIDNLNDDSKKHLRFIYLLKDDMFSSKDRTKFFDIIIPVVPYINGNNSYDVFLDNLGSIIDSKGLGNGVEKDFLMGASLYVDEMRLLINICNEFKVYNGKINKGHLNKTKLLAVIIYKNLFPMDFDRLHFREGFLFEIMKEKQFIIESFKQDLKAQIEEIEDKIKKASDEIVGSEEELKVLYAGKEFPNAYSSYFSGYVTSIPNSLSSDNKKEYEERLRHVKDKALLVNGKLESERYALQKQLSDINAFSFSKLIREKYGSMESFINAKNVSNKWNERYKDIQESVYLGYIKFAVGNGYIDERYPDYIQEFRENSIRYEDKKFLMSVVEHDKQAPDYKLHDSKFVLGRIGEAYFSNDAILNYDLTHALLKSDYDEKKERLITQLKENNNYYFICGIWDIEADRSQLVKSIAVWWPGFFGEISKLGDMYSSLSREFSYIALTTLNDELLKNVNENGDLSSYISNSPDYLGGVKNGYDVVVNHLVLLNVRFVSIDGNYPEALIDGVYKNNLYDLNYENIRFLVNRYYKITHEDVIKHNNYTILKKNIDSPLYWYVMSNFEKYVASYISFCEGSIRDVEKIALEIINGKSLSEEIRKKYISLYNGEITNLNGIDGSMQKDCVANKIISCTISNITEYSKLYGFDSNLVSLINSREIIFNSISPREKQVLLEKVATSDGLEINKYKEIVEFTRYQENTKYTY